MILQVESKSFLQLQIWKWHMTTEIFIVIGIEECFNG